MHMFTQFTTSAYLTLILACMATNGDEYKTEDTRINMAAIIPKSLRAKPLDRTGFEDDNGHLLSPREFPVHYLEDQVRIKRLKQQQALRRKHLNGHPVNGQGPNDLNETLQWFDLSAAVERNMMDPGGRRPELRMKEPQNVGHEPKAHLEFKNNSFFLKQERIGDQMKWTTCEEFGKKAYFHPQEVTNRDWLPFFIWSEIHIAPTIQRFTVPTKKAVQLYRTKQERFFTFTLDWNQPKLLMTESDKEVLLIALDRRGKFRALPWIADLDDSTIMMIHPMTVHMKIKAPYLVFMHCNFHVTSIMAVNGTGPKTWDQKVKEAQTMGFTGNGCPVSWGEEEKEQRSNEQRSTT